ncbi:hypothetical protein EDB19DRAFT_1829233 [Suillus lakei]|nr:hypothetical protein EDB19DRAFT_1829233 [Suillus lakei]
MYDNERPRIVYASVFGKLNHRVASAQDASLRRVLNCSRDEIQVYEGGGGLDDNHFTACFLFRMFQKHLRITQKLDVEFVFQWLAEYGLSEHSLPVHPDSDIVLLLEAHRTRPSDYTTPALLRIKMDCSSYTLVPNGCMRSYPIIKSDNASRAVSESLGDWPMNNSQMCSTRTGEAHLTPGHSREMCSGHLGALRLDRTILHRKKAAFGESLTRRKETGKPHEQRQRSS